MASQPTGYLAPEQYLELERKASFKSEYFKGEVFAMSGASESHISIVGNVMFLLLGQIEDRPCKAYSNDMKVRVGNDRLYTYPDVVGLCGPRQFIDGHQDTLVNPSFIIEVLSQSTEAYDRVVKWEHYRTIESLREYILIAQDQPRIECYSRQSDGSWKFTETMDRKGVFRIESIDCVLKLDRVYHKVAFSD